jgi:hypothetical protein
MANKEVSELTAASALDGTELVHVVQSGNSRKATVDAINGINSLAAKTTPVAADEFRIWDSVASAFKKLTFANLKAAVSSGGPDVVLEDQKSSGTFGGTFTSGAWQTRTLNTKAHDPDGLITLSSNTFTPSVDGWVEWSAPAYVVNYHATRLYNVTDSVVVKEGTSQYSGGNADNSSTGGAPVVAGKTYRLEHRCSVTGTTSGFGAAASVQTEVFARVKFFRSK